ncbi:hypothetical protein NDU88_004882 [Pleurodeles waltl]|uniref:Uncharacterized protein n=1 Tax=Pleurodeles waltl TaxID=8319 RepID=A0AAV7TA14_PLEWA|nr:hypothetical protein NDU88_004882 [Pleurodeles waltl]
MSGKCFLKYITIRSFSSDQRPSGESSPAAARQVRRGMRPPGDETSPGWCSRAPPSSSMIKPSFLRFRLRPAAVLRMCAFVHRPVTAERGSGARGTAKRGAPGFMCVHVAPVMSRAPTQ